MKISKNKKMRFFLMSQGSLNLKIRSLGRKVCSVARVQTDRRTDGQTGTKVNTEDTLSGFQEIFLQPIIKDRPNIHGMRPIFISGPHRSKVVFVFEFPKVV